MSILSNGFKFGTLTIQREYVRTKAQIEDMIANPDQYPDIVPVWNTEENAVYIYYKTEDNGALAVNVKEFVENTNPTIFYPSVSDDGKLTWELKYLGEVQDNVVVDDMRGKSAYQIWKDAGNTGSESEFLAALKGADGTNGTDGKSAYQAWLDAGNQGDESAFILAITGADGAAGKSAYELWKEADPDANTASEEDWLASLKGADGAAGKSAYQIWLDAGNEGDENAFLDSLKGADGKDGTGGTATTEPITVHSGPLSADTAASGDIATVVDGMSDVAVGDNGYTEVTVTCDGNLVGIVTAVELVAIIDKATDINYLSSFTTRELEALTLYYLDTALTGTYTFKLK